MIDLILFWFIPRIPPVIAFKHERGIIIILVVFEFVMKAITIRGPSFCQVLSRRQFIHEMEDITDGNQK